RDHAVTDDGRHVWSADGHLFVDGTAHDVGAAAIEQVTVTNTTVTAIVRSTTHPAEIVRYDLDDPSRAETVVAHDPVPIAEADISVPERIEFPTVGGARAFGWFY